MKKKTGILLKWAVLLGAGASLLQLFKSLTYTFSYFSYAPFVDLLLVLLFIGAFYKGVKEYRDEVRGGELKFTEAFRFTLGMTAVAFSLFFLFQLFHYAVLDTHGLEKINERNREKFRERVGNDTVPAVELEAYLLLVNQQIDSQFVSLVSSSDCQVEVARRLAVIKEFYAKRLRTAISSNDSLWKAAHADRHARKELADLTAAVLAEKEMPVPCGQLLTSIISHTLETVGSRYSILDHRLENAEPKPPVYTNVPAAALLFSFSILLYGIFFGLFVSMYLYKRKKDRNPLVHK